jgi:hypothetical protein
MDRSSPIPARTPAVADESDAPDVVVRERLALRSTVYAVTTGHPDRRPCPPWCSLAHSPGQHEIVARHPLRALHHIDAAIPTVASLYPGEPDAGVGTHQIRTATVESDLTQLGSADPVISVYLRQWEGRRQRHQARLELSLQDAMELGAVLRYLADLAAK